MSLTLEFIDIKPVALNKTPEIYCYEGHKVRSFHPRDRHQLDIPLARAYWWMYQDRKPRSIEPVVSTIRQEPNSKIKDLYVTALLCFFQGDPTSAA